MILDDIPHMQSLDAEDQLGSIKLLGEQFKHGWEDVHTLPLADSFKLINKIVFTGMGGSSLGAYVTKHLYGLHLRMPYEIVNDYHLPAYVDSNTLVITQSYSGTTEETLSCYDDAVSKGAQIFCISTGSTLKERADANNTLHYTINPTYNPCNQPRMAIGYSIVGQLAFLHRLGFIHISEEELAECVDICAHIAQTCGPETPLTENIAKQAAQAFLDKTPFYIAGEFLQGAIHAMRNQINENAKTYAAEHPVPEMNHHLLEALSFPASTKKNDVYVFLDSDLYSPRISQRNTLSKKVIEDAGHAVLSIQAQGHSKLAQIFSSIQFGAYVGLYLAMLEGINPSPIPNVETLKKLLAK